MPPLSVSSEDPLQPCSLQATIDPISQGVGTVSSAWFNAADFAGVLAIIQTGVLGAAATVDAKLRQATSAAGAGAKDVPTKAITQIVKATGDNKQAKIVAQRGQLDLGNGFAFVSLQLTIGGAASLVSGAVLGVNPIYVGQRNQPVAASVAQIVA